MSVTLWWVRHGPTHAKAMVGWTDLPADLSDHAALDRLADYLPQGAAVISSDLVRASATADAIARGRKRLPHDPDLREMHFGAWETRSHAEIEVEDATRLRAFWERPGEVRPPGGETWRDLSARVSTAADRLAAHGGDIVVVAHFGAILCQLQRALKVDTATILAQRIDNLSVTRLQFAQVWTAGEVNHLP